MITIAQVSQAMQQLFTTEAYQLARDTGFIQRQRKITGASFSQMLVLGWLDNPAATLDELCQMGTVAELAVSPQGLDQRFTPAACRFMRALLEAALTRVFSAEPVAIPLLERFNGVYLYDSSIVTLPDALRDVWRGNGGRVNTSDAALKLQVRWDMLRGTLEGPLLYRGREHDRAAVQGHSPLPAGALRLADLGYWKLADFQRLSDQGSLWLSRLQAQTRLIDETGRSWEQGAFLRQVQDDIVDCDVRLGVRTLLPARLMAIRVPPTVAAQRRRKLREDARIRRTSVSKTRLALANWTVLVTNVPRRQLTVSEAMVLGRLRWQIELLFKLWKTHGGVTRWRSEKPWRILCEVYAKLIAMVIQHWCLLLDSWRFPDRSLVKVAKTIRQFALTLAQALSSLSRLQADLKTLCLLLARTRRKNKSRKKPRTYQLLLATTETATA